MMPAGARCGSVSNIIIGRAIGAGLDDLEVDVGHLPSELGEIDDRDLVDTDHRVRIAEVKVRHRPVGMAAER